MVISTEIKAFMKYGNNTFLKTKRNYVFYERNALELGNNFDVFPLNPFCLEYSLFYGI